MVLFRLSVNPGLSFSQPRLLSKLLFPSLLQLNLAENDIAVIKVTRAVNKPSRSFIVPGEGLY